MKNILKIIMALSLATMLTSCGISFGVDSRRSSNWSSGSSSNSAREEVNLSEDISDVNKITMRIDVSDLNVMYHDGSNVEITGKLSSYSKGVDINKSGSTFEIVEETKKSTNLGSNNYSELLIKIPRSFNGDLKLDFGVGSFNVKDLVLNNVEVDSGVGEVSLEEISFNSLDIESGVGSVSLVTKKKTGDIYISGGVGEVNVELGDINGNLKFDGGVGSADIKVPVDAPIRINTKSGLGEANISAKTSNEGKYSFDLGVGLGEVTVRN
ncbi:MAG: DUF4097 family beta strand repeat-containing protein [Clostridium sp.]|uniref:DUF4097 family beta strand repeat-containing protein n=1 Tax=Clostridium sp. TaxID=1506 RepID=UPI00290C9CC3|nr:DUF4097 family beta strand repeat-containing protein [Clostridium sp.]MDU5109002.1 DUF4097 family beta strand repeat-containing protein [Clostridium sp.]